MGSILWPTLYNDMSDVSRPLTCSSYNSVQLLCLLLGQLMLVDLVVMPVNWTVVVISVECS